MVEGAVSIERQCSLGQSRHSARETMSAPKRTFAVQLAMSAKGHKRTFIRTFLNRDTARRHTSRSHASRPPGLNSRKTLSSRDAFGWPPTGINGKPFDDGSISRQSLGPPKCGASCQSEWRIRFMSMAPYFVSSLSRGPSLLRISWAGRTQC